MKVKTYNDLIIAAIIVGIVLIMELTLFFFNHLFVLNFFGIINDIFVTAMVFFAVCFIPNPTAKKIVFTVLLCLITIVFIIDAIFSAFFSGFASVSSLVTVGNFKESEDMGGVQMTLSAGIIILEAAIGIFLIWFIKTPYTPRPKFFLSSVSVLLATVLAVLSLNITVTQTVKNKVYDKKIDYYSSATFLYNNFYSSTKYASKFGYFNFRVRDMFYRGGNESLLNELNDFYGARENSYLSPLTGILDGYNVITVTCESFDTRIVDKKLMPAYTSVMEKSLVFDDYFVPTFFQGATVNTEFLTLTGMFPTSSKSWVTSLGDQYKNNDFSDYSLPGQLKKAGYKTYYAHLGKEGFYSRNKLMPNMGFDVVKFAGDLNYSPDYYDYELVDLLDYVDFSEKFYLDLLTFSMHKGNDGKYITSDKNSKNYENSEFVLENYPDVKKETRVYYAKAKAFDDFVARLMDRLERENVLDKTIVLFYPDHYVYLSNGELYSDLGVDVNSKEIHRQLLTMYLPEAAREKVVTELEKTGVKTGVKDGYDTAVSVPLLCSSTDVTPTLLNLVTGGGEYRYFAGQDAFKGNNHVFFSDYTVYDGNYYYNLNGDVSADDGSAPTAENLEELRKKLEFSLEMSLNSSVILDSDYFRKIKG